MAEFGAAPQLNTAWSPPATIDEARARARERFRTRLQTGEQIGACGCGEEAATQGPQDGSPNECVVGVRFRDSGRVYYFRPTDDDLHVGDWVVVPTVRGQEAARVVIAPHQVRTSLLQGDLRGVSRRLNEADIGKLDAFRRQGGDAVRTFGERARARRIGLKPIAADYSFDGSAVVLSYSVPDRDQAPDTTALRDLARDLAGDLDCRVELRQVGPRDEARLLGGLGRCGRTLCCSSWLPVFPEISMGMAKNQDLPLNPAKVSGVCGRLLCCLSYENDQYRQLKAVMPKLGQAIETPNGVGQVVSMQLLRQLVTVRLELDQVEVTYRSDELGLAATRSDDAAGSKRQQVTIQEPELRGLAGTTAEVGVQETEAAPSRKRRRRRGGRRGSAS